MSLTDYLHLIRVKQWYKNLVVLLALFFSANLFEMVALQQALLAVLSLVLISSSGYIFNDLIDLDSDRRHPEKRLRPLASGRVSKTVAIILMLVLILAGFVIAWTLGTEFVYLLALILVIAIGYTLFLKKIVFADVLTISTLFVLRAMAGALAIKVEISPWLILCPFFLALFLAIGKRQAELAFLKDQAAATRKTLRNYDLSTTNSLMLISTTLLISSYALYSFLSEHQNLLYTLPLALFVIFRYYYLVSSGSSLGRHPEKVFTDRPMLIGMLLWIVLATIIIYI